MTWSPTICTALMWKTSGYWFRQFTLAVAGLM